MRYAEYAKIDAVNWSSLKNLRDSPLHYKHGQENARADNASMALGRACHTATFEPDQFLREYVVFKGKTRRGKVWDAFRTIHPEDTILKANEYDRALAIRDAVRAHPEAARLLNGGQYEQFIQWTDPETGLECKSRLDCIAKQPALVDLKSTGSLSERLFMANFARMGYHVQFAMYREGWRVKTGDTLPFITIAVEAKAPHDVGVFEIDEEDLHAGHEEWRELMTKLVDCRKRNEWPGRYPARARPRLPLWVFGDNDEADELGLTGWKEEESNDGNEAA